MEKSRAAVLVFIGAFLLYLGIFGTSGFSGLPYSLTPRITDTFPTNTVSPWWTVLSDTYGGSISQGPGLTITGNGETQGGAYTTAAQYDLTTSDIKASVDTGAYGEIGLLISNTKITAMPKPSTGWTGFLLVSLNGGASATLMVENCTATDNYYYYPPIRLGEHSTSGTLELSISNGQINFLISGSSAYSEPWQLGNYMCYVTIYALDASSSKMTAKCSSFELDTAGTSPSSQYSDVTVSIVGSGTANITVGDHPSTFHVGENLYISATAADGWSYSGMKRNGAAWTSANPGGFLNLGQTESIEIDFTQGQQGQNQTQTGGPSLQNVMDFINSEPVRTLMVIAGVLCVGVGGITLVTPHKPASPPPPQPRYRY
jgi:hypothetical protein